MSDDGAYGITIIAFIGSVFSPYYAWARRSGDVNPMNHCAINVATYGKRVKRWAMTERGCNSLQAEASRLQVGPSAVTWDDNCMTIHFDEITVPWPSRLRGTIKIWPEALTDKAFLLNPDGRHLWWPIAPQARAEVTLESPSLSWRGHAYVDHNRGDVPIADGFQRWDWSRAANEDNASIFYDGVRRNGDAFLLGLNINRAGDIDLFEPQQRVRLPAAPIWRIPRATRTDQGMHAEVLSTLEDTPFYARSLVRSRLDGEERVAVHESLSLDRFTKPIVQMMLPFRMPRRA